MNKVTLTIDKKVRLISGRFRVRTLPDFALALPEKPRQKQYTAAKAATDRQFIPPTKLCTVAGIPVALMLADWKITAATRQKEMFGPYEIMLFHLNRGRAPLDENMRIFERLCTESLWQVRAFCNPFSPEDGSREVADGAITVNLNSRQRLLDESGHPIQPGCSFVIKSNTRGGVLVTG